MFANTDYGISLNTPDYIFKHFKYNDKYINLTLPYARIYFSKSKKTYALTCEAQDQNMVSWLEQNNWKFVRNNTYLKLVYRGCRN